MNPLTNMDAAVVAVRAVAPEKRLSVLNTYLAGRVGCELPVAQAHAEKIRRLEQWRKSGRPSLSDEGKALLQRRALFCSRLSDVWPAR